MPGPVSIIATGAAADIATGGNNPIANGAVVSTGSTVSLDAGRDLLLGTAGQFGDVNGVGVTLLAGRNITVDFNTFVDSTGAGTVSATASGDITVANSSRVTTQGGAISLTAGANGAFLC